MSNAPGAVFFDRDGTLNVEVGYAWRPEDLAWTPGAIEAVGAVNAAGLLAIVATNQSGIARGYYREADMHAFHARMADGLARAGAHIDAWYFCPYHPDATTADYRHPDHPDRKPNPGMLLRAIAEHGVDPARSLIVGDRPHDLEAGARAGVAGVLYGGGRLDLLLKERLASL
ncbi:MAG: HAD family hydrolase [Gammaproteobacteria bacterium]|nr:HAD family hydrolase [Gammaproteobacteria bacterium]